MNDYQLDHNSSDSLIRRPDGLCDAEWDYLVNQSCERFSQNPSRDFMRYLIDVLLQSDSKPYKDLLKKLGVSPNKIERQNWEHTAFRFFRHFCPEDARNALGHSGLPFANLEWQPGYGFYWLSRITFNLRKQTPFSEINKIESGTMVTVTASCKNSIESIIVQCDGNEFEYYSPIASSRPFGEMMYSLKKCIMANKGGSN